MHFRTDFYLGFQLKFENSAQMISEKIQSKVHQYSPLIVAICEIFVHLKCFSEQCDSEYYSQCSYHSQDRKFHEYENDNEQKQKQISKFNGLAWNTYHYRCVYQYCNDCVAAGFVIYLFPFRLVDKRFSAAAKTTAGINKDRTIISDVMDIFTFFSIFFF